MSIGNFFMGMGLVAGLVAGVAVRAEEATPAPAPEALYTAGNLWYEQPMRMSCINYQVGAIIPAGSEVRNLAVEAGRRPGIVFTVVATGITHRIEFTAKYHPGKTIEDLKARLFTPKTLAELTEQFTDQERECVRLGSVATGISREAVLVAWGTPPEHRTPLLTGPIWTFWTNRFVQKTVTFDQNGKVASVR